MKWRQWGRAQWAASLAMAVPLLASFGELPWLSPLSNLAIPLIGSVLTPAALLASALPTDLGVAWVAQALDWAMWPLEHLAGAPMWAQAAPTALAIALASLGVAVLSLPAGWPGARWGWRCACRVLPARTRAAARPGADHRAGRRPGPGGGGAHRAAPLVYDTGARVGASDMGARVIAPFWPAKRGAAGWSGGVAQRYGPRWRHSPRCGGALPRLAAGRRAGAG